MKDLLDLDWINTVAFRGTMHGARCSGIAAARARGASRRLVVRDAIQQRTAVRLLIERDLVG